MRRKLPGRCTVALLVSIVAGCATPTEDQGVVIAVRNESTTALRCTILFGHWVEQTVGTISPGASLDIGLQRQGSDGALFVGRDDGRKMMVENLVCGPLADWWERRGDIPLVAVRAGGATRFTAVCTVSGKTRCTSPQAQR